VGQIADRLGDADIKGPVLVLIGRALETALAVDHQVSPNLMARWD
jgi:hypothetical protein